MSVAFTAGGQRLHRHLPFARQHRAVHVDDEVVAETVDLGLDLVDPLARLSLFSLLMSLMIAPSVWARTVFWTAAGSVSIVSPGGAALVVAAAAGPAIARAGEQQGGVGILVMEMRMGFLRGWLAGGIASMIRRDCGLETRSILTSRCKEPGENAGEGGCAGPGGGTMGP